MKDNAEVTALPNYTVKVEGERHSLLIKSTKPSDGGKYCVTAVNQMGRASSSAILTVKLGKFNCLPPFILPDTRNDFAQFKFIFKARHHLTSKYVLEDKSQNT